MSILRYDRKKLVYQLQTLPNRLRVAFAAACAERQLPNYLKFSDATGKGSPQVLSEGLDFLWHDLGRHAASNPGLSERLDACMDLLPKGHQETLDFHGFADDAVMTVAYAIRTRLTSDPEEAASAASVAYSALDEFVSNTPGIDEAGSAAEDRIVAHPLVQAEFRRQQADLSQLRELVGENESKEKGGLANLRRRAQLDSRVFFGSSSP
jgi:uncharacterized protein YjaG (DUF416 family)